MKKLALMLTLIFTGAVLGFFIQPCRQVEAETTRFGELLVQENGSLPQVTRLGVLLNYQITPAPVPTITVRSELEKRVLGVAAELISGPKELTVAVLGDSMVDVLQDGLPQLRSTLAKYFSNTKLNLFNFGVGASNLDYALFRLTNEYEYLGRHFPSVLSVKPDVLVIESFAYNNYGDTKEGLDKQWLLLGEIADRVRELSPKTKIVLASTIAPNSSVYGDGIDGIHWDQWEKVNRSQTVKKYLENLINFAVSQKFPLADAYHPSLDKNGEGRLEYINFGDHLHPSGLGGELFCQRVAEKIAEIYSVR